MEKQRLEELKQKYLKARHSTTLMKEFIESCTKLELDEIRLYILDNLLEPKIIEVLNNSGYTVASYKAELLARINKGE